MDDHEQALERAITAFSVAYDAWVAQPDDADVAARYLATHTAMINARLALRQTVADIDKEGTDGA